MSGNHMLTFRIVDHYDAMVDILDGPYHPPMINSVEDLERFEKSYQQKKVSVGLLLDAFLNSSRKVRKDYSIGHYTQPSRGIGVVLNNRTLFSAEVIGRLHDLVKSWEENYALAISGEHELGEDFYIGITKDPVIFGYSESPAWLRCFGFN